MALASTHRDLEVYQKAFAISVDIYKLSKCFPKEELYSLTNQIRRSSRSVCANIAEAFRRRIYPKSFISKLNECEAEMAETQNRLDFALHFGFISQNEHEMLDKKCNKVIGMIINMRLNANKWQIG